MSPEVHEDQIILIGKVGHPRVQSGELFTPYHLSRGWQLFNRLPEAYSLLYELANVHLTPRAGYKGEGFTHHSDGEFDLFTFTASSDPTKENVDPPIATPWFKPPTINMGQIISPYLRGMGLDHVYQEEYRGYAPPKGHLVLPILMWDDYVPGQPIDFDKPPLLTGIMEICPFNLYERDGNVLRRVADDPYRVMFSIVVETAHLNGAPPTMVMGPIP